MSDADFPHVRWVAKAESDLLNIENNITGARIPWDTLCFHAQQAAEKYLKALLVKHRVTFPRTHDLGALLTLALSIAPQLKSLKEDCDRLTPYGIAVRYPDNLTNIEEAEGREAVEAARRIQARTVPLLGRAR